MARNRKTQSAAIRFGPALKALLLCLLIGGAGVGYVWQKEQILKLSVQIKTRELRLTQLKKQAVLLRKQLANARTPQYLELRIKEANLGLCRPQMGQIVQVSEPSAEAARQPSEPQFAVGSDRNSLQP
jgi:hypothetical protein